MQKHEGGFASIYSPVPPNPHPSLLCLAVLFITIKKQCMQNQAVKPSARILSMRRTLSYISAP